MPMCGTVNQLTDPPSHSEVAFIGGNAFHCVVNTSITLHCYMHNVAMFVQCYKVGALEQWITCTSQPEGRGNGRRDGVTNASYEFLVGKSTKN